MSTAAPISDPTDGLKTLALPAPKEFALILAEREAYKTHHRKKHVWLF